MKYTYSYDAFLVHMLDELEKSEKGSARYRYIFKSVMHRIRMKNHRGEATSPIVILRLIRIDLSGRSLFGKVKYIIKIVLGIGRSFVSILREKIF